MSKVGLPLMGDTAGFLLQLFLAHCYTLLKTHFICVLTCQQNTHFNMNTEISKQGLGAKISIKDVLKRKILRRITVCVGVNTSCKFTLAQYLNKTHILTCILKHINSNKVPRAKILTQIVLKRQILTDSSQICKTIYIGVGVGASVMF